MTCESMGSGGHCVLESGEKPARGHIAIVGAGPAGLMAAEIAARGGASVTIYERMPSPGRKFLLAGRGGLNLTHSEPFDMFCARYGEAAGSLRPALEGLTPDGLRAWCEGLGQAVFTGTSGRVFPATFKTSPLLRAWLRRLDTLGVVLKTRHRWTGFDPEGHLLMEAPEGVVTVDAGAVVLALGGASWPQLGADGTFANILARDDIEVAPLIASNCGALVNWSPFFRDKFEGQPLKAIAVHVGGETSRGELVITRQGLEGGAIYAVSQALRDALACGAEAIVHLALKPDLAPAEIERRLGVRPAKQSFSTFLRKALGLSPLSIALLREAGAHGARPAASSLPAADLARLINAVPVPVTGTTGLARSISSAGGVRFAEITGRFMLSKRKGVFVAGEMLDWDAPTGGYLLQACFATGAAAARGALAYVGRGAAPPKAESGAPSRS